MDNQLSSWNNLESNINDLIFKVNFSNTKEILRGLISENLVRGRGLFCKRIIEISILYPHKIPSLTALVSFINSKFEEIGFLLLKRLVLNIQTAYSQNSNFRLPSLAKLLAHLINHRVVYDNMANRFVFFLLENPTEQNIEIAVCFILDCGDVLGRFSPEIHDSVFQRFEEIIDNVDIENKTRCLIEGLFTIQRNNFQGYEHIINQESDILDLDYQVTHNIQFGCLIDPETFLDEFKIVADFLENEKRYSKVKRILLHELEPKRISGEESTGSCNKVVDKSEECGEEIESEIKYQRKRKMSCMPPANQWRQYISRCKIQKVIFVD